MTIGVILDPGGPNAADDLVAQGRAAKANGLASAPLGQRFDLDAVGAKRSPGCSAAVRANGARTPNGVFTPGAQRLLAMSANDH